MPILTQRVPRACIGARFASHDLSVSAQVVSTEYFDPTGRFCQAQWARMLLSTMQAGPLAGHFLAGSLCSAVHSSCPPYSLDVSAYHCCASPVLSKLCSTVHHLTCAWYLQEANGSLRDKRELYTAARHMVRSLHDVYSEFLPPAQVTSTGCKRLSRAPVLPSRCWPGSCSAGLDS